MSKFFKLILGFAGLSVFTSAIYAQATVEEVIVTAQRTEQSLQDVPISVSAFSEEILSDRQIEYASDLQLQVPGVTYSADGFNSGGFAIRGIANFATSSSSDAGVEVHINGLPLGATSTNELGFLDMERIEVLRGPQGTLFGRNSTGGVINMITAKPDLDEFYGRAKVQYGTDNEKQLEVVLNVPISDVLGARFAFSNFEKDGLTKNLYSKSTGDMDDRNSYQWRASFQWNPTDDSTLSLIHSAYDEESNRVQISGTFCDTASSLVQGCTVGGDRVFNAIHPMSNGSTVPAVLGKLIDYYVPSNLTNGTAPGQAYAPTGGIKETYTNRPTQFFETNDWKTPTHDVQESNTQLIFEKDFDQGTLAVAYNNKKRFFYRDQGSTSEEANGVRWTAATQALPFYNEGFPMGFSNEFITPQCKVKEFKDGSFCPGGAGIITYSDNPQSGSASHSGSKSTTYEIKYVSDLDGPFNFLLGAIDISNTTRTVYDVYASGITGNGIYAPGSIVGGTRDSFNGLLFASTLSGPTQIGPVSISAVDILTGQGIVDAAKQIGDLYRSPLGFNQANITNLAVAYDMAARVDGLYTEHFHNVTERYGLDSKAIFTEFYFDVGDQHKITLGLRYNEDTKSVVDNAYFYKVPLISDWSTAAALAGCAGFNAAGTLPNSISSINATTGEVTYKAACVESGERAATKGQQIGQVPGDLTNTNGSLPLGALPADNANYVNNGVSPIQDFSETTGRFVWDYQIDDDTLFYMSYSQGFKGGGFNPPFNASKFPNTEFVYPSTEVKAIEFGVKATVPEAGLTANTSFYYNDFKNYTISVIRNETGINEGFPLEQYGAELELYLAPPTVPGLTFNAMVNYQTSEIGTFSMINSYDLGQHYAGNTAVSSKWHVAKDSTANSFLLNKEGFGSLTAKWLQVALAQEGGKATALAARKLATGNADYKLTKEETAGAQALAARSLRTVNELAFALTCSDPNGDTNLSDNDCGGTLADPKSIDQGALNAILPLENSSHATAYGGLSEVCHMTFLLGGNNTVNDCLPQAALGTAAETLIYAPEDIFLPVEVAPGVTVNVKLAGPTRADGTANNLLPSIAMRGTGTATQTGGVCKLFKAMTDHAANVTATNQLSIASNELCVETLTASGKWISTGINTPITGNEMPFPELSVGFGIAYTAQAGNLEITPRLDYYYQSEFYNDVFNIEVTKVPAWDEWNFSMRIVPTNGDWNIRFYAQNLTDERNITGMGTTGSSTSHTTNVWVREPRSFGMAFGIDF